jgi:tetratricopeptide (TPR) repeat protein
LKKASEINPELEVRVTLEEHSRIRSRETELLYHLELLEESYRLYANAFARGRQDLIEDIAHLLMTLAETHLAAHDFSGAAHACDRAIQPLEKIITVNPNHPLKGILIDLLTRKAGILTKTLAFAEAIQLHDRAIEICKDALDPEVRNRMPARMANVYLSKSRTLGVSGKYSDALEMIRKAAEICQQYRSLF